MPSGAADDRPQLLPPGPFELKGPIPRAPWLGPVLPYVAFGAMPLLVLAGTLSVHALWGLALIPPGVVFALWKANRAFEAHVLRLKRCAQVGVEVEVPWGTPERSLGRFSFLWPAGEACVSGPAVVVPGDVGRHRFAPGECMVVLRDPADPTCRLAPRLSDLAPLDVSPEQLEAFRQRYESLVRERKRAWKERDRKYLAAYVDAHSD
jgi:hypothetical protein